MVVWKSVVQLSVIDRGWQPGGVVFLLAFSLGWFCTNRYGVGLNPDSASYLSQAASLRAGRAPFDYSNELTSHYPPGYPLLVAGVSAGAFRDVRHGAPRLVAAVCMAVVALATWVLLQVRQFSPLATCVCLVGIVLHPSFVENGVKAQTEMPYLATLCLSLVGLEFWLRQARWGWLALAAFMAGVGCLIRYAGVVWPVAAGCVVLFCGGRGLHRRVWSCCYFLMISFLPLFCWMLYAWMVFPKGSPRSLSFHPVKFDVLTQGVKELSAAVCFRGSLAGFVLFGVLSVAWIFSAVHSRKRVLFGDVSVSGDQRSGARGAVGIYLVSYLVFLCLSISFLDRATPLDARILLPATWGLVFLVCEVIRMTTIRNVRLQELCFWTLLLWFGIRAVYETVPVVATMERDGIGLATAEVLYDKSLGWVREECPPEVKVYSNVSWIPWLVCKRPVFQLTSRVDYTTGKDVQEFEASLDEAVKEVLSGESIIVIDTAYDDPNYLPPTLRELTDRRLKPKRDVKVGRFVVLSG